MKWALVQRTPQHGDQMKSEDIISSTLSKCGSLDFVLSPEHRDRKLIVRWIKVAEFKDLRLVLGLSSNGFWVRLGAEDVCLLRPGDYLLPLLPSLELPRLEFIERLASGLTAAGLPAELITTFPKADLVITGLRSESEHWIRLALGWIESGPVQLEIKNALSDLALSKDKRIPQALRHAAHRILNTRA